MRVIAKKNTVENIQMQLLEAIVQINSNMAGLIVNMINSHVAQRTAPPPRRSALPPGCEEAAQNIFRFLGLSSNPTGEQIRDALVSGIETAKAKNDEASQLAHAFFGTFLIACAQYAGRLPS